MSNPTRIHSVALRRSAYPTRLAAVQHAQKNGHRVDRVTELAGSWVLTQRPRSDFVPGSLRRVTVNRSEYVMTGRLKLAPGEAPPEEAIRAKLDRLDMSEREFFQLDIEDFSLELRANGKALAVADRSEMLRAHTAGELVELTMDVIGFQQLTDKPTPLPVKMAKFANARFVTFRQNELAGFAKSFAKRPFLADHNKRDLRANLGTILSSEAIERGKFTAFQQAVKPKSRFGIEAVLRGTIELFSIGFDPSKPGFAGLRNSVFCTVCACPLFSAECGHLPGDVVEVADSGESVIVEAEFRKPRGTELSATSFPAVTGTHVRQITPDQ